MPSLDFETEKKHFREYYDSNRITLEDSKKSLLLLIDSLVSNAQDIEISKTEGRVKEREECISKFTRKYRPDLEKLKKEYCIIDHISDLVGLRIFCLYEDEIEKIKEILTANFELIDVTDKISEIEGTESLFGYKGLHVDLKLNEDRLKLAEYRRYKDLRFEVQIRTVVQDSWSVIDHKIKYKKSIPNALKRRINTLAALFELADREFRAIRDSTKEEITKAEESYEEIKKESESASAIDVPPKFSYHQLDAFSFERIANHFFNSFEFESHKVDGFVQEIVNRKPDISRGKFNFYMRENIATIKKYKDHFEKENMSKSLNPYTIIRHCLYLGDRQIFEDLLTKEAQEAFDAWLATNNESKGTASKTKRTSATAQSN
jgi:putative GTP pyrophosphokinase